MKRLALAVTLLLGSLALAADRPNIVWINCEDLSPALGCYGDRYATTPNLDALAAEGVVYRNAFATAPICSPSRSCLATGLYATSLGTQHLRCEVKIPAHIKPLPVLLREGAGYFCTNTGKTDWNFDDRGAWDHWTSGPAPWRARKDRSQPFFTMYVIGTTHEGSGNFRDRYDRKTASLPDALRHDASRAVVPPFYPDTPAMRDLWARYHDLATALDMQVGDIVAQLKDDGLWDDTIVFFFSDHGHGLPRFKRWLNDSGLRVPLIVRVPERWKHLAAGPAPGSRTDRLVSFVDFAPTALAVAGLRIPPHMQGSPFLGGAVGEPRRYVYGARSRADDMWDMARAVHDGRYLYVRHFMPHLPYLQGGKIFSADKESFAELYRAAEAGELPPESALLFAPSKPIEELYDLRVDPHELNNLADSPAHRATLMELRSAMRDWVLATRDTGFLNEAEYHARAGEDAVYTMARSPQRYDLRRIVDAAELVGDPLVSVSELRDRLADRDSGVRYWAAMALRAMGPDAAPAADALRAALRDASPSVRVVAAEALVNLGHAEAALPALDEAVRSDDPRVSMFAARTLFLIGDHAKPLVPTMREVIARNASPPGSKRPWKDFNYAAFTTWSLEWALKNCGAPPR